MSIIAKDTGGSDIAPIPSGMHPAVCYAVIDIGTQPQFGNYPSRPKIVICWEIPSERIELERDGKKQNLPRALSEKFTLTLASKGNLRAMLESWRGRAFTEEELAGFDIGKLLGANCLLNVVHEKGKGEKANRTYANVASVSPLMKGMPKLKAESPLLEFSMAGAKGPIQIPGSVPEWIMALIIQSEEYQAAQQRNPNDSAHKGHPDGAAPTGMDEDVPF